MRLIDADAWERFFYEHMNDEEMVRAKIALDDMPTIEERHRGKWILCTDGRYYCQDCHIRRPDFTWDYCPQCGALMVKEGET